MSALPQSAVGRVGVYEIGSPLGVGGMGEVYRARDTRLDREVAIKFLLDAAAHDPDRLARFEREAKLLASLNHPHIAQIYGLEDSGPKPALVMELVEGPTLADRIAQGALPLDEALSIARQLAAALEAAHEQGVIHRDLKPANIKLRADGTVKVLDFGLAKLADPSAAASGASALTSPSHDPRRACRRHTRVHESRAGTWPGRRLAHGPLGVGMRVLRDARWPASSTGTSRSPRWQSSARPFASITHPRTICPHHGPGTRDASSRGRAAYTSTSISGS